LNTAFIQSILAHHDASEMEFTLCDVGARGKLSNDFELLYDLDSLTWIGFEPEPEAAEKLEKKYPKATICRVGLGARDETAKLHLTRDLGCASVLEPNMDILAFYPIRSWFEVQREIEIELRRYDSLMKEVAFPAVDFVKVDTQGLELDILKGMGRHLRDAICLELEVHLLPLYRDQALLPEVYQYLFDKGFELITMQQQGRFEGAAIEFNAFFIKRFELMTQEELRKSRVWQMMKGVFRSPASMVPIANTPHFPAEHVAKYLRPADSQKFDNEAHMRAKRAELLKRAKT
jgi:FkbM family methyltransferase